MAELARCQHLLYERKWNSVMKHHLKNKVFLIKKKLFCLFSWLPSITAKLDNYLRGNVGVFTI